jgi:putative DNA primase/helicase
MAEISKSFTPRPFLDIVETLQLDSVQVPEKERSNAFRKKGITKPMQAANDGHIPDAGRNNTLTSLAGTMRRRGMTVDAINAALQAENLTRFQSPLDESEVDAIAASIMRYSSPDAQDVYKTLTDVGNSERFARKHAAEVLYVPAHEWMIWDGLKWQVDATKQVVELAKQLCKEIYCEGDLLEDNQARMAIAKHAKTSQQAPRIKALLDLARSSPELVSPISAMDAHDMLLGVANGVLDLRTGKLRSANPEDRITRHSPVALDKAAECPQFLTFLNQVTGGNRDLINFLQVIIGYCLTGLTSEQCLFFLYGMGANGKSTFLNLVKELLGGDLAHQIMSETLMARHSSASNDIARLMGVRVVIANEIEDGSPLSESLVKQITGGDTVTARFLYREHFEFLPKFKILMAGNHKPTIRGRDNGIWRRICLIPFTVTISPEKRDKNLQSKLRAELPGILNWAIKGCKTWQKQGLIQPKIVSDAVIAYRIEMDLLKQWIEAACTTGAQHKCKSRVAYASYRQWAEDGGYKPMSEGIFSRELETSYTKVKHSDAMYFIGLEPNPRCR